MSLLIIYRGIFYLSQDCAISHTHINNYYVNFVDLRQIYFLNHPLLWFLLFWPELLLDKHGWLSATTHKCVGQLCHLISSVSIGSIRLFQQRTLIKHPRCHVKVIEIQHCGSPSTSMTVMQDLD